MPSVSLPTVAVSAPADNTCRRCEQLPPIPVEAQTLHCWFPTGHVGGKARAVFREFGVSADKTVGGGLSFLWDEHNGEQIALALEEALSGIEREHTRALLCAPQHLPSPDDLARVEPLARIVTRVRSGWLINLLEERRLTSHFQPIVHALQGALFVNFAPTAIYDPQACLRSTVAAIDKGGLARDQVVFELVETERAHDASHLRRILDYYRGAGFRIALDDVGAGYSSLNLIHLLRPDILKLDMELIRDVDKDPYKARIAANLLNVATSLGIAALAEGIETQAELDWVREYGAKFVQGYLIARPAAAPRYSC